MAAGSDQPECGLDCFHGDVCVPGVADFSGHPTKQNGDVLDIHVEVERHGYHCACHPGYTGLRCGLKYEDCADIDHKCYNGGTCLLGLSDIYGNDQLFCDCSGAVDENGVKYVGKYCEIPKTETCDAEGEFFCVNSGYCKTDYGNYPRRPCHCGPLHDGPHCEFEKDAMPECTLECHNKGACRLGIKQISPGSEEFAYDFWKEHSDYQYCECPEGFHGLQCEVASNKCGQHHCFHGGECITVTEGTKHKHHCDCTRAHSKDSSYGGVYCQYESDNFCDKEKTENGQLYCVNDGVCHEAGSHLGCECPPGFHGPICEFKDADQAVDYEQCALTCDNGGQCRKGVKDTSFLEKFGKELSHLNATHDSNFEHCVCPKGFIGLTCEHSLERCTSGEHVCLHGSTCAQDEDACDCEAGSTISEKLAGKFCEHASTSICTEGTSTSSFSFCVNNGECVDVIMEDNEE
jgi:Notch-like protein